ncbi:hypothetical protein EON82_19795 [bacterium]|nr:MAG: hypothetical protein EON82_19795 [bacterium]
MTHRNETPHDTPDAHPKLHPRDGCLGNGCGDFGFIEDLSTLIALKLLVDDLEFDAPASEDSPHQEEALGLNKSPHLELHANAVGSSGSDLPY